MVSWVDWGGGSWIKLEQLGRTWKNWVKKVCWPGHEPGMTWFLDFEPILRCSCCVSLRSQDVLKWQRQHQYVKTMCVSFCFFLTNGFLVLLFERPLHFGTCCNRLNASSCASQEMHHIYLTLCQEIGCFLSQQITFFGGDLMEYLDFRYKLLPWDVRKTSHHVRVWFRSLSSKK